MKFVVDTSPSVDSTSWFTKVTRLGLNKGPTLGAIFAVHQGSRGCRGACRSIQAKALDPSHRESPLGDPSRTGGQSGGIDGRTTLLRRDIFLCWPSERLEAKSLIVHDISYLYIITYILLSRFVRSILISCNAWLFDLNPSLALFSK